MAVRDLVAQGQTAERRAPLRPLVDRKILAFAPRLGQLAADDCALLLWAVWSQLPAALQVIQAAGFEFKTVGFVWVKTEPNAEVITLTAWDCI